MKTQWLRRLLERVLGVLDDMLVGDEELGL